MRHGIVRGRSAPCSYRGGRLVSRAATVVALGRIIAARHARARTRLGPSRHSAAGGTVARTSATQSSSGSSPEIRRPSAPVTGAPTPARSSARASNGTDSSASTAWPMRAGISAAGTPAASSSPARRLRLVARQGRGHQVARAGQADHRLRAARPAPRRSATPRRRCARRPPPRRSAPAPPSRPRRAPRRSWRRPPARRRAGRWTARRRPPRA